MLKALKTKIIKILNLNQIDIFKFCSFFKEKEVYNDSHKKWEVFPFLMRMI